MRQTNVFHSVKKIIKDEKNLLTYDGGHYDRCFC